MITIFKNANNILVVAGDYYFYGERITKGVIFTLALIIVGAILAGINDLQFSAIGYTWTLANCVASSAYVLYLKTAMRRMQVDRFAMVYYNSLIGIPMVLLADCVTSRHIFARLSAASSPFLSDTAAFAEPIDAATNSNLFWFIFMLSGCTGFALSLAAFFCINVTSPTTYSMVGAVNKVPLVIIGIWLFSTP